jgi:hypothetical protein
MNGTIANVVGVRRLWCLGVVVVAGLVASLAALGGVAGSLPPGVSASDIPPVCTAKTNPNYCLYKTSYGSLSISPHFVAPGSEVTGTMVAGADSGRCGCGWDWGDEPGDTGDSFVHTFGQGDGASAIVSGCKLSDKTCTVRVPLTAAANGACCLTVTIPISTPQGAENTSDWYMFVKGGSAPPTTTVARKPPPASQLKVVVSAPRTVRSGLAMHDLYGQPEPQSLVDFVEAKPSGFGAQAFRCESGCVEVVVKVFDAQTHSPVAGARVTASVGPVQSVAGEGYLCDTDPSGRSQNCGRSPLLGLVTNVDGQILLRYWAPGVIAPAATTIGVTARDGTRHGSGKASLTVNPYLIYEHTGTLTQEDITELAKWAQGPSIFAVDMTVAPLLEKAVADHLQWLEHAELATEKQIQALHVLHSVPFKVVSGALDVYEAYKTWTELREHWAMIGLFLQRTGLNGSGLGDDPIEDSAPAYPTYPFAKQLANYNGLVPGNLGEAVGNGEAGAWWDIATILQKLVTGKDPSVQPGQPDHWAIQVKVDEVSNCDVHEQCDPGYDDDRGIQAELYFRIALLYDGKASPGGANLYTFTTPYDALAWAEAQQSGGPDQGKLLGLLHN